MSLLSDNIRALRGDLSQDEMAVKCGLSRPTVSKIEQGDAVKLSTLRQISESFHLTESKWLDLVIAWIRSEVGDPDFQKLEIYKAGDSATSGWVLHEGTPDKIARIFGFLPNADREQIVKAMKRPEVLRCLPAINKVWEKFDADQQKTTHPKAHESHEPSAKLEEEEKN